MKQLYILLSLALCTLANSQVSIGTGTAVDSNAGITTPISNWYNFSLSQFIYTASEINASAGSITSIDFKLNGTTALTYSDDMIDVWVGHTTNSTFSPTISSTGADWIPVSAQTQTLSNGSLTQTGDVVTFTFTTPFAYNGTDNLVITIDANESGNDGSSMLYLQSADFADTVCLIFRNDTAANNPDPLNPPLNFTDTVTASSVQAKTTKPLITIQGLTTTLGVEDINALSSNSVVYPNPVRDNFTVKLSESFNAEATTVTLSNVSGKTVKTFEYAESFNVSSLAKGIYIVTITDGVKTEIQKLIKE